MKRLRAKLSYANVVSTICLFLLLGGGAAYAAVQLPKNSVGSKQLKDGAVTQQKLASAAQAALTGAQGPIGPKGDSGAKGESGSRGDTGPAGPSNILSVVTNSNTNLSESGGFGTEIATLTDIPAGKYLIEADVSLVNFGQPDFLRCHLKVGASAYPGATVSAGVGASASFPVGHLTTSAAVDLAETADATLECSHDTSGFTPYADPGVHITAIRTGDLQTQIVP